MRPNSPRRSRTPDYFRERTRGQLSCCECRLVLPPAIALQNWTLQVRLNVNEIFKTPECIQKPHFFSSFSSFPPTLFPFLFSFSPSIPNPLLLPLSPSLPPPPPPPPSLPPSLSAREDLAKLQRGYRVKEKERKTEGDQAQNTLRKQQSVSHTHCMHTYTLTPYSLCYFGTYTYTNVLYIYNNYYGPSLNIFALYMSTKNSSACA